MNHLAQISLIIPTYDGDVFLLKALLKKIYTFSVMPKQIIVVASGVSDLINYVDFPVDKELKPEIILCQVSKRFNQAKARNIGAKLASCRLLMFHDVDDLPHPSKFQITEQVFLQDPSLDFLVHGHAGGDYSDDPLNMPVRLDYALRPHPHTMGIAGSTDMAVLNSHVTIFKKTFDMLKIQFDESPQAYRIEDSLLTVDLIKSRLRGVMVVAKLVRYIASGGA